MNKHEQQFFEEFYQDLRKQGITMLTDKLSRQLAPLTAKQLSEDIRKEIVHAVAQRIGSLLNPIWTYKFTAEFYNCSVKTIQRRIASNLIPTIESAGEKYIDGRRILEQLQFNPSIVDITFRKIEKALSRKPLMKETA